MTRDEISPWNDSQSGATWCRGMIAVVVLMASASVLRARSRTVCGREIHFAAPFPDYSLIGLESHRCHLADVRRLAGISTMRQTGGVVIELWDYMCISQGGVKKSVVANYRVTSGLALEIAG